MPGDHADDAAAKDRVVELLAQEWTSLSQLLERLDDATWSRPALPGWDVHDVVAHLVGTERMLAGAPAPEVSPDATGGEHVKNGIARMNEIWIVSLRARSHAELRDDFSAVTAERLSALRAMTTDDFAAPSWTPVGDATYGRFMEVRVFDTWMHEQDIRAAVDMPGHDAGPVAEQAIAEVVTALGYIVGKKAAVPAGSSVTFELDGPVRRSVHVAVGERATVVPELPGPATATLTLPSSLFVRLAGGRVDPVGALGAVAVDGDGALGHRVATHLAYTI
ncbi:MAG: maleylpyruvate isomerase family mycothiol-dependent enzyme [Acidimicrobiales bacterium]